MKIKAFATATIFTIMSIINIATVSAQNTATISVADDGVRAVLSGSVDLNALGYHEAQIKNRVPYYPLQVGVIISDIESGECVYANQLTAAEDGTYSTNFILSSDSKAYNVKIYTAYCKVFEGEIDYSDGIISKLNETAQAGDNEVFQEYIEKNAVYMGIDLSKYKQLTEDEQNEVIAQITNKIPFDKKTSVAQRTSEALFNVGLTSQTLSDEEKTLMLNTHIDELGEEYAAIGKFISENALEIQIIERFAQSDYDTVESGIYHLALMSFLENRVENIYDLEALYEGNIFSIPEATLSRYNNISKKTTFLNSLYTLIPEIKTLQDFYDKTSEAITAAELAATTTPKPSYSGGGGSPSGGGGGGGGGVQYYAPITVTPTPTTPPTASDDNKNNADNNKETVLVFNDLESFAWAQKPIYELAKTGAVSGDGNGNFMPEKDITREAFIKIIASVFSIENTDTSKLQFEDVHEGDWYYKAVMACVANNITDGISDTHFGVGENITRQDAATLIARILKLSETEYSGVLFADNESIADYAKNSVYNLKDRGVINGYDDNTFNPHSKLTRAEAAKMIYMAMQSE